ncbi:hypothetical protein ACMHYB_09755 [Sorangium sp. So ce1128]
MPAGVLRGRGGVSLGALSAATAACAGVAADPRVSGENSGAASRALLERMGSYRGKLR